MPCSQGAAVSERRYRPWPHRALDLTGRSQLCPKRTSGLMGYLVRALQSLLPSPPQDFCGFALNSYKQNGEIPGTEILFLITLYCPSLSDSAVGKSQLLSEPE